MAHRCALAQYRSDGKTGSRRPDHSQQRRRRELLGRRGRLLGHSQRCGVTRNDRVRRAGSLLNESAVLSDLARETRRRIALRLTPFLFVLYLTSILDRVNVSYASLEMTRS